MIDTHRAKFKRFHSTEGVKQPPMPPPVPWSLPHSFLGDLHRVSMPTVFGKLSQATVRLAGAEASGWTTSRVIQTFSDLLGSCPWSTNPASLSFPICQGDKSRCLPPSRSEMTEQIETDLPVTPQTTHRMLPRVHFPRLIEAAADKKPSEEQQSGICRVIRGCLEPLKSQTTGVTRNNRCLKAFI